MPIIPSPAVLRACDVLGHMARHPAESFTVSDLARVLDVPRATCDAILQALAARRYVTRRDGDRRYQLGAGSIALGEAARAANPVLRAATVEAEALARATATCVAVCVRDGTTARVVEVFDFASLFALRARVGQTIPLVPPFGAVFVAWAADDAQAWLARAGDALGRDERERYRRVLSEVRRRGYSISVATRRQVELTLVVESLARSPQSENAREARDQAIREMMHSQYLAADLDVEADVRVAQISAPVFDQSGRVTTCLLVPGPEYEINAAERRDLAGRIVAAAGRATRSSGGVVPSSSEAEAQSRAPA